MGNVQIYCVVSLHLHLVSVKGLSYWTPLSFSTFCLSYVLSHFSCSLGIFQVRAYSHSQAQVTQNINSPSNCMSQCWGVGLTLPQD